jgi:hypothetical protein
MMIKCLVPSEDSARSFFLNQDWLSACRPPCCACVCASVCVWIFSTNFSCAKENLCSHTQTRADTLTFARAQRETERETSALSHTRVRAHTRACTLTRTYARRRAHLGGRPRLGGGRRKWLSLGAEETVI